MNVTLTQAEKRLRSAEAAVKAAEATGDTLTIDEERRTLYGQQAQHSLLLANEAADRHVAEGSDPIPRTELIEIVNEATWSKIEFGEEVIRTLEESQRRYGRWTRWHCKARAADGAWRAMSEKAFARVLESIEPYCPRRSDNGLLAPPWRLKFDKTSTIVPEDPNA